jgi:hypothetical protein
VVAGSFRVAHSSGDAGCARRRKNVALGGRKT